mmetsp:Transcript_73836/g.210624  ORF Transcript_73836/g.210624 Transcript_73836/m.210624 type:complete len:216 (-) Transcript_73836:4601-5248(-)
MTSATSAHGGSPCVPPGRPGAIIEIARHPLQQQAPTWRVARRRRRISTSVRWGSEAKVRPTKLTQRPFARPRLCPPRCPRPPAGRARRAAKAVGRHRRAASPMQATARRRRPGSRRTLLPTAPRRRASLCGPCRSCTFPASQRMSPWRLRPPVAPRSSPARCSHLSRGSRSSSGGQRAPAQMQPSVPRRSTYGSILAAVWPSAARPWPFPTRAGS